MQAKKGKKVHKVMKSGSHSKGQVSVVNLISKYVFNHTEVS